MKSIAIPKHKYTIKLKLMMNRRIYVLTKTRKNVCRSREKHVHKTNMAFPEIKFKKIINDTPRRKTSLVTNFKQIYINLSDLYARNQQINWAYFIRCEDLSQAGKTSMKNTQFKAQ